MGLRRAGNDGQGPPPWGSVGNASRGAQYVRVLKPKIVFTSRRFFFSLTGGGGRSEMGLWTGKASSPTGEVSSPTGEASSPTGEASSPTGEAGTDRVPR